MKTIDFSDSDARIFGIREPVTFPLRRLTDGIITEYPRLKDADRRPVGARLCFRTASKHIGFEIGVENVYVDRGMSFYQANLANCFIGSRKTARLAGIISAPNSYDDAVLSESFENSGLNDVTVYLPRNPSITFIKIMIDDDAEILPPTPFELAKPFVFYGSSITENGHTSSPNAYTAQVSRHFDADFYNFGFSGNACGEEPVARLIAGMDMSIFFYDYDHNAPSAEHLKNTHEKFFRIIRQAKPELPIIMSSRPSNDTPDYEERKQIVRQTYENAVAAGDRNVYFIDGADFFGDVPVDRCVTDGTHPNDLGHYLMAQKMISLAEKILK